MSAEKHIDCAAAIDEVVAGVCSASNALRDTACEIDEYRMKLLGELNGQCRKADMLGCVQNMLAKVEILFVIADALENANTKLGRVWSVLYDRECNAPN